MKKTVKQAAARNKNSHAILPPGVKKGDTLGLVAPAGSLINPDNFTAGVKFLKSKGFKVSYNPVLLRRKGYLAGSDRDRADEFNTMWADPEIKALVAARGGYGSLRMLDMIDMKRISKYPKILIGFSDLTVLLNAITGKTGLVTCHGPVVTTLAGITKQSQASFLRTLSGQFTNYLRGLKPKVLRDGSAAGLLFGGNLTTLVHTIGTPYEIPWDRAILFIEDTGEPPYRLDRLLTHMDRAGRLRKVQGLILGTFSDNERKKNKAMQETVHNRAVELLAGTDIPVWTNFPVGHSRRNLTLPIGMHVKMDSGPTRLAFINDQ